MSKQQNLDNINVLSCELMPTPLEIKQQYPLDGAATQTVLQGRTAIQNILDKRDPRMILVVGPCSIHDLDAAREYAQKLRKLSIEVEDSFLIVMRVYFEKPRTTVGWKGLINDPDMNDSFHIEKGMRLARGLLLELAQLGLPTASEALDPLSPQYLSDLLSWVAIGARTTESQTHREMASGLSMPAGFKNATDGSLDVAINALQSVSNQHHFLGMDESGRSAVFRTRGNRYAHVVLRGGGGKTNYDTAHVQACEQALEQKKLPLNIMVDCSHGNSQKDPAQQTSVGDDCVKQIINGNSSICGLMLESNLHWGNQAIPTNLGELKYGVSVTDACIDWETTQKTILDWHQRLSNSQTKRLQQKRVV